MNTVIVYDSQFGNTEQIALVIANALSASGQVRAVHVSQIQPIELGSFCAGYERAGWLRRKQPESTATQARFPFHGVFI